MIVDGIAYSIQGRTDSAGQISGLSLSLLGKASVVSQITLSLGVTLEIDSQVLRVMDVASLVCRDFEIIEVGEDNTIRAREIDSEVTKKMGLKSQVVRSLDIESIVEMDEE